MTAARPQPVRVLFAEDVAIDAELAARALRRSGMRLEMRVVQDETGFRSALADFAPHVILSDFTMPGFDGMHALAIAHEMSPGTPFLFVSGTLGEEHAIRALQHGAVDYVLKGNLLRLPAAVDRALVEAEERRAKLAAERALRDSEERFRGILESAADGIAVCDASRRLISVNRQFAAIFGHAPEDLPGTAFDALVPENRREAYAQALARFARTPHDRRIRRVAVDGLRKDGTLIALEIGLSILDAASGAQVTCIVRDVTEREAQARRLERLSRVRDLAGAVNASIVRVRERVALLEAFCRIAVEQGGFLSAVMVEVDAASGVSRMAAGVGEDSGMLGEILDDYARDPTGAKGLLPIALRSGKGSYSNDATSDPRVRQATRRHREVVHSVAAVPLLVGERVAGAVVLRARERGMFDEEEQRLLENLCANLSFALELMEKQTRLDYLAFYDPLTGLPNRTLFATHLEQGIEAARQGGERLSLMVFDIERFKSINDAFGTSTGDRVLQQIAERIRGAVPDLYRVARVGGDQFAVITPRIADASDVARRLEGAAAQVVRAPYAVGGQEIRLSAKAGIAIFPEDGDAADALYRNAEAALHKAKQVGEEYVFYAPQINARVSERLHLENRLRRALENGEFELHYQPKVELATRQVVGFEALLRWREPGAARPASPAVFVPVLEEIGLILPVGHWAMGEAVAQHRRWCALGLDAPRIAVNVSAIQLRQRDFVAQVRALIDGCDAGACGLDLEITESLLMADVDESIRKLREVREAGVHVALDDFGTGYSSLAYLNRLPIDTVKIDRSFVRGMTENADDTSIVTLIISLAQSLRLRVVAEGVETEQQAQLLRLLRCDQMQGYLFSRPVPPAEADAFLRPPPA